MSASPVLPIPRQDSDAIHRPDPVALAVVFIVAALALATIVAVAVIDPFVPNVHRLRSHRQVGAIRSIKDDRASFPPLVFPL